MVPSCLVKHVSMLLGSFSLDVINIYNHSEADHRPGEGGASPRQLKALRAKTVFLSKKQFYLRIAS